MALDKDGNEIVVDEQFETVNAEGIEKPVDAAIIEKINADEAALKAKRKPRKKADAPDGGEETPEQKAAKELEAANAAKITELGYTKAEFDALTPEEKENILKEGIKKAAAEPAKKIKVKSIKDGKEVDTDIEIDENEGLTPDEIALKNQLKDFEDYKEDETPGGKTKDDKTKAPGSTDEEPEEIKVAKKKAVDYDALQAKYEELNSNPYVIKLKEFQASGKDASEFIEFLGIKTIPKLSSFKTPTDGDMDAIKEMITAKVQNSGLPKGDIEGTIQEEIDSFDAMTAIQRKEYYDSMVAVMKTNQKNVLEESLKNLKSENKSSNTVVHKGRIIDTSIYAEPEKATQIIDKAEEELNTALAAQIGKTVGFVVISQKVLDKIAPVLIPFINTFGVERDKNNKVTGYKLNDEIFEMAVMAKFNKLNTQEALKNQKIILKKQWLMEHNIPDGGIQRATITKGIGNKGYKEAVVEGKGKIEYIHESPTGS